MQVADIVVYVGTVGRQLLGPAESLHCRRSLTPAAVKYAKVVPCRGMISIHGECPAPGLFGFAVVLSGVGDASGQHVQVGFDDVGAAGSGSGGLKGEGLIDPRLSAFQITFPKGTKGVGEMLSTLHGGILISRDGVLKAE